MKTVWWKHQDENDNIVWMSGVVQMVTVVSEDGDYFTFTPNDDDIQWTEPTEEP